MKKKMYFFVERALWTTYVYCIILVYKLFSLKIKKDMPESKTWTLQLTWGCKLWSCKQRPHEQFESAILFRILWFLFPKYICNIFRILETIYECVHAKTWQEVIQIKSPISLELVKNARFSEYDYGKNLGWSILLPSS